MNNVPERGFFRSGYFFPAAIILLCVVSASVYINALQNGFVYDDAFQILENRWIRDVRFIPDIFGSNVWGFSSSIAISNHYRPMMHLIYMLNYYIFGLDPWGFHLTNILFHASVTILVFLLARKLFVKSQLSGSSYDLATFAASMLFATHPIHTEAVTWIAGVPDLSYTFFLLLSFYLYMRVENRFRWSYSLSVVTFLIATLCKEPALVLPIILIGYDYVFYRIPGRDISYYKRYIPYLFVSGIYMALRLIALRGFAPQEPNIKLSTYGYIINVFPLFMQYLQKLILPIDLNAFHVFYPIYSIGTLKGILSLTVTTGFVILAVISLKKNRLIFFSLLLIALPLLPAFYIPASGGNVLAERYLYLPSFGFVMIIVSAISRANTVIPKIAPVLISMIIALTVGNSFGTKKEILYGKMI